MDILKCFPCKWYYTFSQEYQRKGHFCHNPNCLNEINPNAGCPYGEIEHKDNNELKEEDDNA